MLILRDCKNFLFSRTSGKPYLSGAATLTYKAVNSMAKFCLKTHSLSIFKGTCTELFNLQWITNPNLLSKCNGHALRKDLVRSKSLLIEFLDTYYVLKSCASLKDFLLIMPPNENKGSIKFKYIQQKYCTIDNAYDHLLMILPAAYFKVGVS